MPGRKPKPTKLKVLQGNPGKRKLPKNEPKPDPVIPDCPSHLDAIAKKEWKRFAKVLDKLGLLTEIDGSAFAAYCDQYSRWVKINHDLKVQEKELQRARKMLARKGDEKSLERLSRLPVSSLVVHDYTVDTFGQEHIKISQNPLIIMARQTLQQIRAFCTEFGMTPSSRGRIQIKRKETESPEDAFLKAMNK